MEERRADCKIHEERISSIQKSVDEMKGDMIFIKKLLIGNGIIGVAEQARRAFESVQIMKQTKSGWLDWIFRIVITTLIGMLFLK